jgi:hypothetical protein
LSLRTDRSKKNLAGIAFQLRGAKVQIWDHFRLRRPGFAGFQTKHHYYRRMYPEVSAAEIPELTQALAAREKV